MAENHRPSHYDARKHLSTQLISNRLAYDYGPGRGPELGIIKSCKDVTDSGIASTHTRREGLCKRQQDKFSRQSLQDRFSNGGDPCKRYFRRRSTEGQIQRLKAKEALADVGPCESLKTSAYSRWEG